MTLTYGQAHNRPKTGGRVLKRTNQHPDLDLTLRQRERLERLWRRFSREQMGPDVRDEVLRLLAVDIGSDVFGHAPTPLIASAGPSTATRDAVAALAAGGWGAALLPAAAVADVSRSAGSRPWIRSSHAPDDRERLRPVVTAGNLDFRGPLDQYLDFCAAAVAEAANTDPRRMRIVAGLSLGGLPVHDPPVAAAVQAVASSGVDAIRLADGVVGSGGAVLAAAVPLWLECAAADPEAQSCYKGLILPVGQSAPPADSAPCQFISGRRIYTGLELLDSLAAGATGVHIFDFLVGKVGSIIKRSLSKPEQVAYKILLDPADGLVAGLAHLHNTSGVSSLSDVCTPASGTEKDA